MYATLFSHPAVSMLTIQSLGNQVELTETSLPSGMRPEDATTLLSSEGWTITGEWQAQDRGNGETRWTNYDVTRSQG